jgi:AP-1-like factor
MATSASTTDADSSVTHSPGTCQNPKSKEECREKIAQEGNSMFAPPIQKNQDQVLGTMVTCVGSSLPKTAKNDQNIEVLTAWKNIRSDPKFKVCLTLSFP